MTSRPSYRRFLAVLSAASLLVAALTVGVTAGIPFAPGTVVGMELPLGSMGSPVVPSAAPAAGATPAPGPTSPIGYDSWLWTRQDPLDESPSLVVVSPLATPAVARAAWTTAQTAVRAEAHPDAPVQNVLPAGFPVTIQADQGYETGLVRIRPDAPDPLPIGWVPGGAVTDTQPAGVAAATFDAIDPDLASYLASLGSQVGVSLIDLDTGITYGCNADEPFITASSVKVAMLLTLLRQREAEGQRPSADEVSLVTAMIEESDSEAAEAIDGIIGDRAGLTALADQLGLTGFKPGSTYDQGWGWGTLTPATMTQLLALFEDGKVLDDDRDTALARDLLANVDSDRRTGVGTTAPGGASVLLKNGWVPGPDGLWVFNSSGIVESPSRTYVIAAYMAHDASLEEGQEIVEHVCAAIATDLG